MLALYWQTLRMKYMINAATGRGYTIVSLVSGSHRFVARVFIVASLVRSFLVPITRGRKSTGTMERAEGTQKNNRYVWCIRMCVEEGTSLDLLFVPFRVLSTDP